MTKFKPSSINAMMDTYSKFDLDGAQLKQLKSILESGKIDVTTTNALISDDAYSELGIGKRGPASAQAKQSLLDFINKNTQATAPTQPAPTPSPAPKPKVDPQRFLNSKKANVQPKTTQPQVTQSRPVASPTPTPKVTFKPTPAPAPTPKVTFKPTPTPKTTPKPTSPTPKIPKTGPGSGGLLQRGFGLLGRGFGAAQALNPNASVGTRLIGAATAINPMLGLALSSGAAIGQWAQENLPESDFVSGRGSGSAALSSKKQRKKDQQGISETIPQSLKAVPATPAEMPVVTGPNGEVLKPDPNNPGFMVTPDGKSVRGDLTGGKGPISEDTDTGYPTLPNPNKPNPEPGAGSGGSETRTSVTGLNQYGKTLGGLNQFTKEFTKGYEIADLSKAFKSEDLPTAYKPGSNTVGYSEDTKYDLPAGATPTTLTRGSVGKDSVIPYTDKPTYDSPVKTVGVLGGNPENPQDGTSDKPDVADKIRQVRMARNEGSARSFNGADFSDDYGDEDSYVSPMYANERRNKIRSTFLHSKGLNSVQAAAAANAVANYGKDSDGRARFNVGGKLVYAKDGMEYEARNAAMMAENPMQYLDIPSTPDTKPDQPAASEISPSSMSIGATDTKPDFSEKGGTFPGGGTTIRQDPEKYKETQQFLREKMGSNFYGN